MVVKNDRYIFLWFRYRIGLLEEFCIKKLVGFVMFDFRLKIFNIWEIFLLEIFYDEFVKFYIFCVRDEIFLIFFLGKLVLVLDEVCCKWIIFLRKLLSMGF